MYPSGLFITVERPKVHFKLGVEIFPIGEPGRLGVNLSEDGGLEMLKGWTGEVRDGILNL